LHRRKSSRGEFRRGKSLLHGASVRLLKNAVVAFFNLAKFGAKLLTARKRATFVGTLASPPCDAAGVLQKSTSCYPD
jgi:hypothetical protein